jgi:hypothetical protein
MNLLYGKDNYDKKPALRMKLIVGISDQFLEKEVVKVNESEMELFKQPVKK